MDAIKNIYVGQTFPTLYPPNNKVFGHSWRVYLVLGKIMNLLWLIFAIGKMFFVVNSQILKK